MFGLNLSEIVSLLMVIFTCCITIANLLMWHSTRRTIRLQVSSNYSLNHQSIISGHRELFLGLLHQPDLLKTFATANGLNLEKWELQIISAFFINHTFAHYLNFKNKTLDEAYLEGFKQDAREIFSLTTVKEQWQQARSVYSPAFQEFVDTELISDDVTLPAKA